MILVSVFEGYVETAGTLILGFCLLQQMTWSMALEIRKTCELTVGQTRQQDTTELLV